MENKMKNKLLDQSEMIKRHNKRIRRLTKKQEDFILEYGREDVRE